MPYSPGRPRRPPAFMNHTWIFLSAVSATKNTAASCNGWADKEGNWHALPSLIMCSSLDSLTLEIPTHWTCTDLCEMKQRRGMSEVCEQEGTGEEARGHSAKAQVTCCFQRRCYQSRRGNMNTQRIWSNWGMHVHRKKTELNTLP